MTMPNFRTITSSQALERLQTFDQVESMVRQIVLEELKLWDCPDEARAVAFSQVPLVLDCSGNPFRVHQVFDRQSSLAAPALLIYMKHEPWDKNILEECVDVLRNGKNPIEWVELHGEPPLSTPSASKFGIEFGGENWSAWFPPTLIDLPCRNGKVIEYLVGDKTALQQWADNIKSRAPSPQRTPDDDDDDDYDDGGLYFAEDLLEGI